MAFDFGDMSALPLIMGYAFCSSLLAIINKYAITVFAFPSLLTALQYLTCVVAVLVFGKLKLLEHDPIKFSTMRKFLPAACVFYLALFTNTTLLKYANVETFIVFRSSTPLLVAVADTLFRKQPLPNRWSVLALFVILLGAVGYVRSDSQFNVRAYSWALAYLVTIVFEMVYLKHIVSSLDLNIWGYVLYNNLLSLLIAPLFWYFTGEFQESYDADHGAWLKPGVWVPVGLSCLFGLAISFFGFACRKAISATAFTVVGVTNKLLTVIINLVIWDKHASGTGILCLLVTIFGGVLYQQTVKRSGPLKKPPPPEDVESRGEEEEGRIGESFAG